MFEVGSEYRKMANIPPWAMDFIQSLSDEQQATLVQIGAKAAMDPWFGALASVPAMLSLVYLPHFIKLVPVLMITKLDYNNVTPRYTDWDETLKNRSASEFVKRCISCHQNSIEAFIAFVPAVLMCRVQKADGKIVRELCWRFIKLRLLYSVLYLLGSWRLLAAGRTLTWSASMQTVAALYGKALLA